MCAIKKVNLIGFDQSYKIPKDANIDSQSVDYDDLFHTVELAK
jgi:hypothetical protein